VDGDTDLENLVVLFGISYAVDIVTEEGHILMTEHPALESMGLWKGVWDEIKAAALAVLEKHEFVVHPTVCPLPRGEEDGDCDWGG